MGRLQPVQPRFEPGDKRATKINDLTAAAGLPLGLDQRLHHFPVFENQIRIREDFSPDIAGLNRAFRFSQGSSARCSPSLS